jgi:hypothetical protein
MSIPAATPGAGKGQGVGLKQCMPGLVIQPAHDPTAAQRLIDSAP